MSDDRLHQAALAAARRFAGEEPPPDVRDRATTDTSSSAYSPSEYDAWRTPAEPEAEASETEDGEPPNEGREPDTELGRFLAENAERGGWGARPAPEVLTLEDELEGQDQDAAEPFATTARGFIEAAVENEAEIRAEFDLSVDEYLAAWALADREAWAATGLPMEAQPGAQDLGRSGRALADGAAWEAHVQRLRDQGRYFGQ